MGRLIGFILSLLLNLNLFSGNLNININQTFGQNCVSTKINYEIPPRVMFVGSTQEIIAFETSVMTRAQISYGENYPLENKIISADAQQEHQFILDKLQPDKKYQYQIKLLNNNYCDESFSSFFYTYDAADNKFSFVVFGDSAPEDKSSTAEILKKLSPQILASNPNFIITVGDNAYVYDADDLKEIKKSWLIFFNAARELIQSIPMFATAGNHDETDQETAYKYYQKVWLNPKIEEASMSRLDELAYKFQYGNSLFIILNSEELGKESQITGAQLEWLKKTLNNDQVKYKFIFSHKPFLNSSRSSKIKNSDEFHQLFLENKVTAVFTGHDHFFCDYQKDGIYYITTGGAAPKIYTGYCTGEEIKTNHFLSINVDKDKITLTAINEFGNIVKEIKIK